MTQALEQENLFVVAVDNRRSDRVYPQNADFTFYGGLYRDVNIICVSESHFDLDYYGTAGLKITPEVTGKDCRVDIRTWVTNHKPGQNLRYTICAACGSRVDRAESAETQITLYISDVHLWNGRKAPCLYTAYVELMEEGRVLDAVCADFGCRTFAVDPERGFLLNGEEYPPAGCVPPSGPMGHRQCPAERAPHSGYGSDL